jgi:hypothetical protein
MKQVMLVVIIAAFVSSCGSNQSKTQSDAKQLTAAIKKMMPSGIPTAEGGWTMTAKINGRDWAATSIMPLEETGRIIGDNNGEGFGFPYDKRDMVVGEKTKFSHGNAVDLTTYEGKKLMLWGGYEGEMEITKVDGDWVEGKFFVTGSASDAPDKKVEVTDGFFRISLAEKK